MKVVFSRRSGREVEEIADFIAADNAGRAESFAEELIGKARSLALHPHRHPLLDGHEREGIRKCAHGKYVILYRVETDKILVLHILHGARNIQSILGDDDT